MVSEVKWYSTKKGFGFLVNPHGGADIFVHASALRTEGVALYDGDRVQFDLIESHKGLQATNVSIIYK